MRNSRNVIRSLISLSLPGSVNSMQGNGGPKLHGKKKIAEMNVMQYDFKARIITHVFMCSSASKCDLCCLSGLCPPTQGNRIYFYGNFHRMDVTRNDRVITREIWAEGIHRTWNCGLLSWGSGTVHIPNVISFVYAEKFRWQSDRELRTLRMRVQCLTPRPSNPLQYKTLTTTSDKPNTGQESESFYKWRAYRKKHGYVKN
jgi:hypothetical protein